jgi:hypothetical protein
MTRDQLSTIGPLVAKLQNTLAALQAAGLTISAINSPFAPGVLIGVSDLRYEEPHLYVIFTETGTAESFPQEETQP